MLILTRKSGESVTIQPEAGADLSQSVEQFFHNQPIKILVKDIDRGAAKLGFTAHRVLTIMRDELLPKRPCVQRDVLSNTHYGHASQCLAVNLYKLRQSRQWSMNELAIQTGIPVHVLVKIEQGVNRINLDDLEVIAEVFGIEVGGLFKE